MASFSQLLGTFFRGRKKKRENADPSPLLQHVDIGSLTAPDRLLRLGTKYGGWIIPADPGLTEQSVCYLAGAGEDISFDCQLVTRFHCKVRILDPTPRALVHFELLTQAVKESKRFPINNSETEFYDVTRADLERMTFVPVGLADKDVELKFYLPKNAAHVSCSTVNLQKTEDYFVAQCHRLRTLMTRFGDADIDLLKMDIEGGEYAVIDDMLASGLLPRILLIEFDEIHTPLDDGAGSRIRRRASGLGRAGMRCVAVEGSNATFVRSSR